MANALITGPDAMCVRATYNGETELGETIEIVEVYGVDAGADAATPQKNDEPLIDVDVVWESFMSHANQLNQRPVIPVKDKSGVKIRYEDVPAKIKRPNGEWYITRTMTVEDDTITDVAFVRQAYKTRQSILMASPPGTGKTALMEAALEGVIELSCDGETNRTDYVGGWVQMPDGTYEYAIGPLPQAMIEGKPFFVDEIGLVDPRENAVLYPTMDGRNYVNMTENPKYTCTCCGAPRIQHGAEGFYVAAAYNPDVPGVVMSDALLDRFPVRLTVTTDYDIASQVGVPPEIVVVAKNLKRKKEKDDEILRFPQMRQLVTFRDNLRAFGEKVALANFVSAAEPSDQDVYGKEISSKYGRKVGAFVL